MVRSATRPSAAPYGEGADGGIAQWQPAADVTSQPRTMGGRTLQVACKAGPPVAEGDESVQLSGDHGGGGGSQCVR